METKFALFNRFEIEMPLEAVRACSHQGQCHDDVVYWLPHCKMFRHSGESAPSPDDIRAELKECGAWDAEELADDEANLERIVWIAAGNIKEEMAEDRRNESHRD